jgi:radical SAM superfamily enzyme YgiQ (UPF0313 family)
MRVVVADVAGRNGFVSKDTVAGGYGSRFIPFSRTTQIVQYVKRRYLDMPSVQMAYVAAILARWGHEVVSTRGEPVEGDLAIVLSSLVDHRNETAWADMMRARGVKVGFVGLAASKMPQLFAAHADFVIQGEPEEAIGRMARGEALEGKCRSDPIADLDTLPFPRWDLVGRKARFGPRAFHRPPGGAFPLLASRGCREHCTYCPHRILAGYRTRSVGNVVDEIERLTELTRHPHVLFRDPLFSERRDRTLALCDEIHARGLTISFECETRLDRLDFELLARLRGVGLRAINFGVESVLSSTLRRVGRRPIPQEHQLDVMRWCRELGIATAAFFVIGFPTDDWSSIAATIDFAVEMSPTFAQFKILTPYPGTPLWKQMAPAVTETDWERFDGFTPTFDHPNLTREELRFLLGAAYSRFYMRPSYAANLLHVRNEGVRGLLARLDRRASARHSEIETRLMSRPVVC